MVSGPRGGATPWVTLLTGDPDAARDFYGPLLNWTFDSGEDAGTVWRALDVEGAPVALIGRSHAGTRGSGIWAPCFEVGDADFCAARIRAHGGTVAVGPLPFLGGRRVLAADRHGTPFSVRQGPEGRTSCRQPPYGRGARPETARYSLHTRDVVETAAFYSAVLCAAGPGPVGAGVTSGTYGDETTLSRDGLRLMGLVPLPRESTVGSACWQPEFVVADVAGRTARAVTLGATLVTDGTESTAGTGTPSGVPGPDGPGVPLGAGTPGGPKAGAGRALLRAPDGTVFALATTRP
ncbi:hypothetical protein GBW32_10805 [Streptomyces tsukubensis]|uniref:VOC family protein n=1 Tax=Streptomyces tsukubensis TaxID=83656 RepID=UPI001265F0AD|nr:VOC family protein [Streptomyces tsukubensis]QFR93483.1 hypothetical protein GBW32_10805 [Streptomyces tsukubensis]